MKFRQWFLLGWLLVSPFLLFAQQRISLKDIWLDYDFSAKSVPGFNFLADGQRYTRLEENAIQIYDLTTGERTGTLLDAAALSGQAGFDGNLQGYAFSEDEQKILLYNQQERIYRRSRRAQYFLYDRETESLAALFPEGKVRYATFSPQGNKVAFVYGNNLYFNDLERNEIIQVTTDGKPNAIINGAVDWVYEEEFGFARGFQWSPDGNKIAFYRFDESRVKEFTMTNYRGDLYPEYVTFKYPKVGEENSKVGVRIYDIQSKKTMDAEIRDQVEYIPRIKWTQDPEQLCIYLMNRHQSDVELLLVNARNGTGRTLFREKDERYIAEAVLDNLTFLKDGKHFIWTSEQDGWHHIYLYDMKGKLVRQLTKGDWEITQFYGVDEERGHLYFQSAQPTPMQRQIARVDLDGGNRKNIAAETGWNTAQFSSTFDYFVLNHSTINQPPTYTVMNRQGRELRAIETNTDLRKKQKTFGVGDVSFFKFTTRYGVDLNGWMIKPTNFEVDRQYPLLLFVYGGPGSQQVVDSWKGQNYWWFQMLAQKGFVVACVDNRGTGGRGSEFKKTTYQRLGDYETEDQIATANYLGSLSYVNRSRIGVFGWSYGGYLASLCILKGNNLFRSAIAVAPVTNWKWYDTIYTERYMQTKEENPDGYENNSPVNFADRLRGNYLLVHGMGDDNVHFQHTAEMANALVKANRQFDTYFYPNRNHGIYGGNTRYHLYRKMTSFLEETLVSGEKDKENEPLEYIVKPQTNDQ